MATVKNTDQLATPFFRRRIVVIAVSACAMLVAVASVWLAWRALPDVPVREVVFVNASSVATMATTTTATTTTTTIATTSVTAASPFVHLKTEELNRVAQAVASAKLNALRANLTEVKLAVEQIEWVRRADVRRRLPDKIEVRIEEHVPFGIWRGLDSAKQNAAPAVANVVANVVSNAVANAEKDTKNSTDENDSEDEVAVSGMLINTFGEVFKAGLPNAEFAALPILSGPLESSKEVIITFDQFRKQLATIGRAPRELQLSVRRAWVVKLDNGATLALGRNDALQRLQRFTQAQIAELKAPDIYVDLRYASGLALRNKSSNKSGNTSGNTVRGANFKTVGAVEKLVPQEKAKKSNAKNKAIANSATKKKVKKVKAV